MSEPTSTTHATGAATRRGPALVLRGIDKRFGPVVATRGVDLEVARGSIHAVVGENGAGKSTLMKIAFGMVRADAGEIAIKGEVLARGRHAPREALARGVGMVHQHFALVGSLTVVENVVLGREPVRRGALQLTRAASELAALAARFGLAVDPRAITEELSVGEQQRVEILRVLWQRCDVLILDEPTAVLTPAEVRELFGVLRVLAAGGATVVLVTHKLDEVVAVADSCTVLRKGERVAEFAAPLDAEVVARAVIGRDADPQAPRAAKTRGAPVLEVHELSLAARGVRPVVDRVSLSVAAGEILGIAGVEGNGQTELCEALTGLRRPRAGRIVIAGRDVTRASVRARHEAGLGVIPEDRHARGLVLDMSVADNLVLGRQHEVSGRLVLDRVEITARAEALIAEFDVRPPDPSALARALSGGNQQKLVVARELSRPGLALLVCAQPTRGLDIGALAAIHARLLAAREAGVAVLLVSAELSELRALSDRVVVLHRGHLVHEVPGAALADPPALERLGAFMTGARAAPEAHS